MTMTRREVLEAAIAAGAAGIAVACGGTPTPVDCPTDGPNVEIATNHGHALTVPASDISAGTAMTYDIQGTSVHAHQVTVSATDFTKLQNNETVNLTSTSGGQHTHAVTLRCG